MYFFIGKGLQLYRNLFLFHKLILLIFFSFFIQSCAGDEASNTVSNEPQPMDMEPTTEPEVFIYKIPNSLILMGSDLKEIPLSSLEDAQKLGDQYFSSRIVPLNKKILATHSNIELDSFNRISISARLDSDPQGSFNINLLDISENVLSNSLISPSSFVKSGAYYTFLINENSINTGKGLVFPYGIGIVSKNSFGSIPVALVLGGYLNIVPEVKNSHFEYPVSIVYSTSQFYGIGYKSSGSDASFFGSPSSSSIITDYNGIKLHINLQTETIVYSDINYEIPITANIEYLNIEGNNYIQQIAISSKNIPFIEPVTISSINSKEPRIFSFNSILVSEKDNFAPVGTRYNAFALKFAQISGSLYGQHIDLNDNTLINKFFIAGNYLFKTFRQADSVNRIAEESRYYWGIYVVKGK